MGFFRGSFLFTFGVLLLVSFLVLNISLTLTTSLKYDNVQKEITPLINDLTSGDSSSLDKIGLLEFNWSQATDQAEDALRKYCQNQTEYVFNFDGRVITIPCSSLEGGKEAIINETANSLVEEIYYQEYNCDFWDCLVKEEAPFFLVSLKAHDYWKEKFYLALAVSLVLLAITFLLVENKLNWPVYVGSILILSAIPLLKIESLLGSFVPDSLFILTLFLGVFFSKAYFVFWIFFIIGLVLIGLGLGLKFSNLEFVKNMTEKMEKKQVDKGTKTEKKVRKK